VPTWRKEVVVLSDLILTDKGIVIEVENKVKKVKFINSHTKEINHSVEFLIS
jgi:hypothetical protein